MRHLECSCGAKIPLTDEEYRARAGQRFECVQCGKVRRLPLPNVFVPHGSSSPTAPATVPARLKRRKPYLLVVLVAGLILLPPALWLTHGHSSTTTQLAGEPYQVAVRNWIRDNLGSGDCEEVRWWPLREITDELGQRKANAAAIAELKARISADREMTLIKSDGCLNNGNEWLFYNRNTRIAGNAIRLRKLQDWTYQPKFACRLQYRCNGSLRDDVFTVDGKRAALIKEFEVFSDSVFSE